MQHGQIPRNRCLPFARCLNALPCCLLFIWLRKWLPSFGRSWHILPRSSMMTGRRIFYAPTAGCSPSIKNCCIHRHVTMLQGQAKGIDPAMVWPVSPHTLGHPRNWNHFSVSEISEKTDLRTFQDIAKNQFKQQCKRNNYAEIKLDHRPRTRRIQSASGVARFRDTTDGVCSISTHLT